MYKAMVEYKDVPVGAGTGGTVKQSFSINTLVECECIEGRTRQLSKVSQLVVERHQLKHELEEMTVLVSKKDAEIALLKAQLVKAQTEGPGTTEVNELRIRECQPLGSKCCSSREFDQA
ncbi:hypothetical protein KY284_014936 [Solanum tuberosum]|nr:hypothetical protein KY284_014936 [Solanum tuberosum]